MKIKGPGNFPEMPTPPEINGDGKKAGKFDPEKPVQNAQGPEAKAKTQPPSALEQGISEVARAAKAEGLKGEALASRVVDTVLSQMFGKDFLSRPDAAALRKTITPFVAQDEHLFSRLNSVLSRLGNKS